MRPQVYQALQRREARLRQQGLPIPRNPHDNLQHGARAPSRRASSATSSARPSTRLNPTPDNTHHPV